MDETIYDIPMDKISYEIFKKGMMYIIGATHRYHINYNEDYQQATICCKYGGDIQQTQNEYIITPKDDEYSIYFINMHSGELIVKDIITGIKHLFK